MKVIIPVDETDRYQFVLKFISRLGFPEVKILFLHAVTPVSCYDDSFMAISAIAEVGGTDIGALESDVARAHLSTACLDAKAYGFAATSKVGFSFPGSYIVGEAAEFGADLIAIAASQKGPFERLFAGSVSLWMAEHYNGDLLLVRDGSRSSGTCSVTYATDNSGESLVCLKRMLGWNLKGIAHVEILNAVRLVPVGSASFPGGLRLAEHQAMQSIKGTPASSIDYISKAGMSVHLTTVEVPIASAIGQAMLSTNSDVLMLNAAEHGSWWNVMGKSTTVNEIKETPFSLLIMREPS